MKLFSQHNAFQLLLDLLFPRRCPFCSKILTGHTAAICPDCAVALMEPGTEACPVCGSDTMACGCKKQRFFYDGFAAPFYYEYPVTSAIWRFKFRKKIGLRRPFASYIFDCLNYRFPDISFDSVIAVPMFRLSKWKRGYNQAELLAAELAKLYQIPLIKDKLIQVCGNETQHLLKTKDRVRNVKGVYDCVDHFSLQGQTILLVDDIRTTGSTLNECALVLKIYGAKEVYTCSLATTLKR